MKKVIGYFVVFVVLFVFSFFISVGFYHPLILPLGATLFLFMIAYFKFDKSQKRIQNIIWLSIMCYITMSVLWPKYIAFHLPGFPPINIHRIANLFAIVSIVLAVFYSDWFKNEFVESFRKMKVFWIFLAVFCLFRFGSIFVSGKTYHSVYIFLSDIFVHIIFVFAGLCIGANRRNLKIFSIILTFSFFINFAMGSVEFVLSRNLFSSFVDPSNPDLEWIMEAKFRGESYRVNGIFIHPIVYAEFASVSFCFAVCTLLSIKKVWLRYLSIFSAVVCATAMVMMSNSRAGFAAVGVTVSLITFSPLINSLFKGKMNLRKVTFWSFALGFAMFAVGALGIFVYEHTLGSGGDEVSNQARISMLERTFIKLADAPILGYGPGMGVEEVGVKMNRANSAFTIDSLFLSYAVDSGIFAILSFIALIVICASKAFVASVKTNEDDWFVFYSIGVSIITFALFKIILSLVENNFLLYTIYGIVVSRVMLYSDTANNKSGGKKHAM